MTLVQEALGKKCVVGNVVIDVHRVEVATAALSSYDDVVDTGVSGSCVSQSMRLMSSSTVDNWGAFHSLQVVLQSC